MNEFKNILSVYIGIASRSDYKSEIKTQIKNIIEIDLPSYIKDSTGLLRVELTDIDPVQARKLLHLAVDRALDKLVGDSK